LFKRVSFGTGGDGRANRWLRNAPVARLVIAQNVMNANTAKLLSGLVCFLFSPILMAAEESDEAKIQGKWCEVAAYIFGKPSERVVKAHTFSKGKLVQHYRNPKVDDLVHRYRIDEKAKPPRLDLLYPDSFNPGKWLSYDGIYKLDGDTMIWCQSLTGFPPKDIEPGEDNIVLKLKRAK
jgi:uncharacterized protein (TIGR03067 family)